MSSSHSHIMQNGTHTQQLHPSAVTQLQRMPAVAYGILIESMVHGSP